MFRKCYIVVYSAPCRFVFTIPTSHYLYGIYCWSELRYRFKSIIPSALKCENLFVRLGDAIIDCFVIICPDKEMLF